MDNLEIARKFVSLVFSFLPRRKKSEFEKEWVTVLLETVTAAGFDSKEMVLGKLHSTDNRYLLNETCPYKVVSQDGEDYRFATGWLDQLFRFASARIRNEEDRDQLAQEIAAEIERSVPFKPIRLTAEGDLLREHQPVCQFLGSGYFVDHKRDETKLSETGSVGHHGFCGGSIERRQTSERYDALFCRTCYLRVTIPHEIQTYGELRKYIGKKIPFTLEPKPQYT